MLKIGDAVVTMSYPGIFIVVAVNDDNVEIRDENGQTKLVRGANVRRVDRSSALRT